MATVVIFVERRVINLTKSALVGDLPSFNAVCILLINSASDLIGLNSFLYSSKTLSNASIAPGSKIFAAASIPFFTQSFFASHNLINASISARVLLSSSNLAASANSVRVSLWISSISSRYKISFSLPVSGSSARDSSKRSSSSVRRSSVFVGPSDSFVINPFTTSRTREVSLL